MSVSQASRGTERGQAFPVSKSPSLSPKALKTTHATSRYLSFHYFCPSHRCSCNFSRKMASEIATANCPICLGDIENPVNLCVDAHESVCRDCISSYVDSTVKSAFFGSCPCITCPSITHQKSKKKKILPAQQWTEFVPVDTVNRYKALASHLLAFLCGGCHSLKTLDVGFEPNKSAPCYEKIDTLLRDSEGNNARHEALKSRLTSYCLGDIELEEFYGVVNKDFFPQLSVLNDHDAWEIFMAFLKTIQEPERRCNLHLRYLRDRPRMKTLCCNREHCFNCKIKDFHEGRTCLEYSSNLDNSIVTCPSCGIALARGDGCNTITCVCGKQFSWSAEKENTDRCHQFRASFPEDTSNHCANILCTWNNNGTPTMMQAKAWQIRNRIEVNRALRNYFKTRFSPYPSQSCATLVPESQTDGIREAIELWKLEFPAQVARRRSENDLALNSIFLTFYPRESERAVAAHNLVTISGRPADPKSVDVKLVKSAAKWIEANRDKYVAGVEALEERSARQFLYLYPRLPLVSLKPSQQNFPCVFEFDRAISNTDLTYTSNNTTVERVGSVSCYPAVFAQLPNERSMFRVHIDAAPRSSNWLTFGLARRGMAASSSDGVGRTPNTWGISDDRSSTSSHTMISASGHEVAQFRKLQVGDVMTAVVDTNEGWLEVSVNEGELNHRFVLPNGGMSEYVFAMTFANDHRVTILHDGIFPQTSSAASVKLPNNVGQLNRDHSFMLNSFKKHIKLILTESSNDDASFAEVPNSPLITDGSAWLASCENSRALARDKCESLLPHIEFLLNLRREGTTQGQCEVALKDFTGPQLLELVSWYRHNRDQIRQDMRGEMAMNYSLIHGDSAPFLAAMTAAQAKTSGATSVEKTELQAAVAYMQYFAEEMQEWYDLDATSREPLVENVAKSCRCLPRHFRTCPNATSK